MKPSTGPINKLGVIDSGAGGLSIIRAINDKYPGYDIHFYADHLYLPYGCKSKNFIIDRINTIIEHLQARNCEQIIVACHTASAQLAASNLEKPWHGVVQPTINQIKTLSKNKKIGIIGTEATISSGVYSNLGKLLATPDLAGLIEQQAAQEIKQEIKIIARVLGDIDYLVLACTHYPLALAEFRAAMPNTEIINTPELTANSLNLEMKAGTGNVFIESSRPNDNFFQFANSMLTNCFYLESVL